MKLSLKFKLYLVLLLAIFFRFYGLSWDQGFHLHPDERMITMVVTELRWPQTPEEWQSLFTPQGVLNPHFFAYGSFPLYFLKLSGWLFSFLNPKWLTYDWINLLGRGISVLADLGVIYLVYLIGKNIWSSRIGLWGAIFYSLAVFPIQAAHFYAVDSLLNIFILTTLYCLLLFYQKPLFKNAVIVGIFFGLSLATKVSATVLLAAIGIALVVDLIFVFIKRIRQIRLVPKIHQELFSFLAWLFSAFKTPKKEELFRILFSCFKYGLMITITTIFVFLVFEPYALIDFPTFWRQTQEQRAMTKNAYVFPYTLQYVGTTPYLYHLKNLVFWGMGIPLGIFSILGTLFLVAKMIKEVPQPGKENQEAKIVILLSFLLVYFLVVGQFAIKFMRYLLPLYSLLCLFAAWFLFQLPGIYKKIFLTLTLGFSLLWAISFITIYSQPNTRVSASNWINKDIPQGSKLAVEHWDDRVPMWGNYQFLEMPMYEPDASASKWQLVEQNLAQADYLILASNRLYVPLPKLTDCKKYKVCYPKTAQYYQQLFAGQLGFRKVAEFSSYPTLSLLGLAIIDDSADESFTVYDHPRIIIFKRTKADPYGFSL
jgi:hypothetical protein